MRFNTNKEAVRKTLDDYHRLGSWDAVFREDDARVAATQDQPKPRSVTPEQRQAA